MRAGGFAVGSAMLVPVETHDRQTARRLAAFRARLDRATDAAVLEEAAAVERLPREHPLCAEVRQIVDAELAARHLSLAGLAGGAK